MTLMPQSNSTHNDSDSKWVSEWDLPLRPSKETTSHSGSAAPKAPLPGRCRMGGDRRPEGGTGS